MHGISKGLYRYTGIVGGGSARLLGQQVSRLEADQQIQRKIYIVGKVHGPWISTP